LADDKADVEACWPRLTDDAYRITSPRSRRYNCVAWVAEDTTHWWEPTEKGGYYWPAGLPKDDYSLANYLAAFRTLGFEECQDGAHEDGVEKIAAYVAADDDFSHVATQLDDGWWSSKLGHFNDISHERLDSLLKGHPIQYGETLIFMARKRTGPSRTRTGLLVVRHRPSTASVGRGLVTTRGP
jgi:hypothetical protein